MAQALLLAVAMVLSFLLGALCGTGATLWASYILARLGLLVPRPQPVRVEEVEEAPVQMLSEEDIIAQEAARRNRTRDQVESLGMF